MTTVWTPAWTLTAQYPRPPKSLKAHIHQALVKSDELASCTGTPVDQNDGFYIDRTPVPATLMNAVESGCPKQKLSSDSYLANAPRLRGAESKYDMSLPRELQKPTHEWTSTHWRTLKKHCLKKRKANEKERKKRALEAIEECRRKHYAPCGTPLGTVTSEDIAALPELGRNEATNARSYGTFEKPPGITGVSACRNRADGPSVYQIRKAFRLSGYDIRSLPDEENVTSAEWFQTLPLPHRSQQVVGSDVAFFEDRKGDVQRGAQYHEMGWDNDIKGRRQRELLKQGNDTFQHKEDSDAGDGKQWREEMAHSDAQVCANKHKPVFNCTGSAVQNA
ncbi:hypothetical protein HDU85_003791 [Gaertneriomyces sp. JEL0708]|nr:hypothetical protein HDU85_003791 [Gaertneriomyces sp. JEL0708]